VVSFRVLMATTRLTLPAGTSTSWSCRRSPDPPSRLGLWWRT
jgi:hypothetical protein